MWLTVLEALHLATGRPPYRQVFEFWLKIFGVVSPNGIVVDPEETALLVAVTRANQIWRVLLHKSGLVTKVGIFAHLHGGRPRRP